MQHLKSRIACSAMTLCMYSSATTALRISKRLVLSCNRLAGKLLNSIFSPAKQSATTIILRTFIHENLHVAQRHHANSLPDSQTNSRRNAPVQSLDTIIRIDIPKRLPDSQVLRAVRVGGLALHFHTDHLDRLIPSAQTTTQPGRKHLLVSIQLDARVLFARDPPDALFRQPRQTKPRSPIGNLPDRNRIHALIDTPDTLFAVDIHERGKGGGRLDSGRGELVLRDLDRLHASTETHCRVGLRHAADHAA